MKHIKKFESVTKELTEEYIREVLQVLKDEGVDYKIIPINTIKYSEENNVEKWYEKPYQVVVGFSIRFQVAPMPKLLQKFNNINSYSDRSGIFEIYKNIQSITTTLLNDGFGNIYTTDDCILKIFKNDKV